jgi:hypothetical protein
MVKRVIRNQMTTSTAELTNTFHNYFNNEKAFPSVPHDRCKHCRQRSKLSPFHHPEVNGPRAYGWHPAIQTDPDKYA